MATTTTNFGWDIPQSTDLVKDGATAIAALGQDIDTALVDLKGGTTGQVLAKASGTDLDFSWVAQDDSNAIQNAIVDAKGDLIAATAADTPARLAVGTNGQVLTADSTASTGLAWATASAGDLTRITKVTFSGSSAINIDNCFSSTYDFYVIQMKASCSATLAYLYYRMRSGGTNNTSSAYSSANVYAGFNGSAPGNDASASQSQGTIGYFRTTDTTYPNIDIRNPFGSEYTSLFDPIPDPSYSQTFQSIHAVKTSYDGISLYPSGGTLTGELNIYGFKKG
jgi:hypothetical protein